MRVLLTGAFGNVGSHTVTQLVEAGHEVRCLDLPTPANKKRARALGKPVQTLWTDITNEQAVLAAMQGVEHVLHLAAVIPPHTDVQQSLGYRVNVGGLKNLLKALKTQSNDAALTFCSTAAVYGRNLEVAGPRSADEPLHPEDAYGLQKVECEQLLAQSGLPYCVFRLGVTPPTQGAGFDPFVFKFHARTRVEFSHPEDVARALVRSVGNRQLLGKTLLIAGGEHNRYYYRDWLNEALACVGVGRLPAEAFGERAYYTDWMDTRESQSLLDYQRKDYGAYLHEISRGMGPAIWLVRALRPLLNSYVLGQSPYYQKNLASSWLSQPSSALTAPAASDKTGARESEKRRVEITA